MKRKKFRQVLAVFVCMALIMTTVLVGNSRGVSAEDGSVVEVDTHTPYNSASDGTYTYDGGTMRIEGASGLTGENSSAQVDVGVTITVTLTPTEGYKVGTLRDSGVEVELTGDGTKTYTFTTEAGKTYSLEPSFDVDGGGGDDGDDGDDSSDALIQVVDDQGNEVKLVENGELTEVADSIEGLTIEKKTDCDGLEFQVYFDNLNLEDKTLEFQLDERIWLNISGENVIKSIILGRNAVLEADAYNESHLDLLEGIGGMAGEEAGYIRFTGDVILKIGSEDNYANYGIQYVNSVKFDNYDFHNRDWNNVEIYAHNVFEGVNDVTVCSAKVVFAGEEPTLDLIASSPLICTVTQEGQAEFRNAPMDNVTLNSRYYSSYPDGPVDDDFDINDSITDYDSISTTESATDGGHCYEYSYDTNFSLFVSMDPILYSVSYQIDEGIDFPNPDKGTIVMNGFERGYYVENGTGGKFEAWIAEGETVNVTILPEKGYQYLKNTLNINGEPIENTEPSTERGTYTFTMPANAGHICAGFEETEDIVDVDTTTVKAASISNADFAIENGNAKLEIQSEVVSSEEKNNLQAEAGDLELADVLDIDLSEAVIKNYDPEAEDNESWDTAIHELTNPVEISITLSDALEGAAEYKVVRDHEGDIETVDSEYDAETNTLKFTSDRFSTYAIFKTKNVTPKPSNENGSGSITKVVTNNTVSTAAPKTGDYSTIYILMLALVSALGMAAVLVASRNRKF